MRRFQLAIAVALALATLAGCKPEWWPDKGPTGIQWPPPQPETWEGDWPPSEDNPEWWVKHFRNRNDGEGAGNDHNPDEVSAPGFAGHAKFARAFQIIDDPQRPDCGLFGLTRTKADDIDSCTPFPQQLVQASCNTVRNADTAKTECADKCAARPRCREGRLFRPEMISLWGCLTPITLDGQTITIQAFCTATFLCECLERD
jgi:hypothetical protein